MRNGSCYEKLIDMDYHEGVNAKVLAQVSHEQEMNARFRSGSSQCVKGFLRFLDLG